MNFKFAGNFMHRTLFLLLCTLFAAAEICADETIKVDFNSGGRMFEGIGALSAGASSRLLIDYPEPQRTQILDFLFKPMYGASLQHCKVEIGGDINSTDGSEPCHARTKKELDNPKPEYFSRGYEWWLMDEAKKRNQNIFLDALQWGCPGWCGKPDTLPDDKRNSAKNTKFFSQDNADLIASFIKGMKKYHNLTIDYCGVWNERNHNPEWIKLLRKTLDGQGLTHTGIVAADHNNGAARGKLWCIADQIAADPELKAAVYAVGVHYPERYTKYKSTETARSCGKPLWNSEGGPWKGDWKKGFPTLAMIYNRCYILGKITKIITWSLVSSYYDFLPIANSGLMMAKTPWSGYYEVQPGIWAAAHTTQFSKPGWFYIDSASKLLKDGGSAVAMRSPDNKNYSIIIETMDAKKPQTLTFEIPGNMSEKPLCLWRSICEKEAFIEQKKVIPADGKITIKVLPRALYSLSTLSGQKKGKPETAIPENTPFPFPYKDDFETYQPGATPKYFSDMEGAFEVINTEKSKCLQQVVLKRGIQWCAQKNPMSYIGSRAWENYTVSADVKIPNDGFAVIAGRVSGHKSPGITAGVDLKITSGGTWSLEEAVKTPAKGKKKYRIENKVLASGKYTPSEWNNVALKFNGKNITVFINKEMVAEKNILSKTGLAGIGCGYHKTCFDNFSVTK